MQNIKFIGPKYLISPLSLLGIEVHAAENSEEGKLALAAAAGKNGPALIFITERLSVNLSQEIESLNQDPNINVVLIPDNQGGLGLAQTKINDLIKNSIGAEIILRG